MKLNMHYIPWFSSNYRDIFRDRCNIEIIPRFFCIFGYVIFQRFCRSLAESLQLLARVALRPSWMEFPCLETQHVNVRDPYPLSRFVVDPLVYSYHFQFQYVISLASAIVSCAVICNHGLFCDSGQVCLA